MYFASRRTGEWQIWNVSLADGSLRQVTRDGGYAPFPSPDGRFLYYTTSSGGTSIRRLLLPAGAPETIAQNVPNGYWAVATSGIYIARPGPESDTGIVLFWDPHARRERIVRTISGLQILDPPAFTVSPDGASVLYPREDQGSSDIILVNNLR